MQGGEKVSKKSFLNKVGVSTSSRIVVEKEMKGVTGRGKKGRGLGHVARNHRDGLNGEGMPFRTPVTHKKAPWLGDRGKGELYAEISERLGVLSSDESRWCGLGAT